ncbi:peptidyl-tRNA hydrolase [Encephalitozoon hellem ATCC 50504]|uniref:peptidyl-tRNA hydrolase n=1 Tax=Encephalitozoon hellem TaxID=27973 RepID=A0A9Q9C5M0_ENCHE|nr:peptidyl-tRNA hydrolase [Encephalitozoon hellem ATCC 50504]AFM98113.1 peptidyl-tRNA hydrolase [Encephalitozoon hellem ATCC 50504]UTX42957.1 type 2 peptidyl-tRNA hydrolase [Encephalitozoon hellem]WEL38414.1 type 2 peptidyl-tRNA hydrolase [Encephalitozoon hellem]|eukprot:XP_003887094.1 peptidyl-tRNA hydrolase [Encephalitozoon hellem ATCC 50504]
MGVLMTVADNFWKIACFFLALYIVRMKRAVCQKDKGRRPVEKGEYGMNIIINTDYSMSKGKVISQICHGMSCVMCHLFKNEELLREWKRNGEAKIVLKASENEIQEMIRLAKEKGIYYHKICDAGRTQVPPGANTVLILGPALRSCLSPISGHLKLY